MSNETKLSAIVLNDGRTVYLTEEEDDALTAMGAEVAARELSEDEAIQIILDARQKY